MKKFVWMSVLTFFLWPAKGFAVLSFDLLIPAELHITPGSDVNVPAWIQNTGTESYMFKDYSTAGSHANFLTQFSNVMLNPGDEFAFIFEHIVADPALVVGDEYQLSFNLSHVFPDGTQSTSVTRTQSEIAFTRVFIENAVFMTDRRTLPKLPPGTNTPQSKTYLGSFGYGGHVGNNFSTQTPESLFFFNMLNLGPGQNALTPSFQPSNFYDLPPEVRSSHNDSSFRGQAIPEPSTVILTGLGIAFTALRRRVSKP